MNRKIEQLLQLKGSNHIFPFLWLHGEEEAVIREYMAAIYNSGIGAVCLESRPHPDYCGPKWWQDLAIIIEEAKKREMKVWILDDSHFPTGYANGEMKEAPEALCRQALVHSTMDITGPMPKAQLNVAKQAKFSKNPFASGNMFSMMGGQERRKFEDDQTVSICAGRVDQGLDSQTLIDLSEYVVEGELTWDVPAGTWRIYVNYLTRNAGNRDGYIHMVNRQSVRKLIDAVYEPHFKHFGEEFGQTIAGFFSDEPELGNGEMYNMESAIGKTEDLPWSEEVEAQMKERLGNDWSLQLPLLWEKSLDADKTAYVRHTYMDILTRLVETDFSKQLGSWCEAHHVEYIGHLIEDNNAHTKMGPSLGHFFRGLSGQHMSGIDDIGGQVLPGGEAYPMEGIFGGKRDGEFFHYMLGKLGSSLGAIDPIKKGRTMCEIFGAYGWSEGVREMKYLLDHFLVRGVNQYVPHAFSAKAYPDPDCPPHFYANGHDAQYRHFGYLMRYLNRMASLISDGARVTPVGILYEAEAQWAGNSMLSQKPAHVLMDRQIDFDILPADIFTETEKYLTQLGQQLVVNNKQYQALVVPYSEYLLASTIQALVTLQVEGMQILFVDGLPTGVIDGDQALLSLLEICQVVTLETMVSELVSRQVPEITVSPAFPMLRYLHYREESDVYLFTNENMAETFKGTIQLPKADKLYQYDAWHNKLLKVVPVQTATGTEVYLEVAPYQSVVLIMGDAQIEVPIQIEVPTQIIKATIEQPVEGNWQMSLAKSIEYPNFHDYQTISTFENVGMIHPEFSGFIRYENQLEVPSGTQFQKAVLTIEDAFEGVEVFVNGQSVGIQVALPFLFEIGDKLQEGLNGICIEVATTLERERYFAPPDPADFMAKLRKSAVLAPTGIVGEVKIWFQKI